MPLGPMAPPVMQRPPAPHPPTQDQRYPAQPATVTLKAGRRQLRLLAEGNEPPLELRAHGEGFAGTREDGLQGSQTVAPRAALAYVVNGNEVQQAKALRFLDGAFELPM